MNKNKKIALITGAGNGIGAETAIELSKNNMHVIISDKSLSSLNNTENTIIENGGTCTVVELDMKDFLGIDRLGIEIFKRWKKLDVLISNAAILGTLGPIYHQSNDEFLDVVNVNLISNHRLIRSFDSLLKNNNIEVSLFQPLLVKDDSNVYRFCEPRRIQTGYKLINPGKSEVNVDSIAIESGSLKTFYGIDLEDHSTFFTSQSLAVNFYVGPPTIG